MVKLVGENARDLHVIALGVSAGDVFNGNVGVGRGALLPVARRVGTFHADAELAAFGRGRSCFPCRGVCVLRGGVVPAPQAVRASSMRAASRVAMVLLRFMVLLPF